MRFSVVFGVTLRLLVINIFVVDSSNQHRRLLPAMCHNLRQAGRAPPVNAFTTPVCCSVSTGRLRQSSQIIGSESRFLPTPRAFDDPVRGVPVGVLPYPVWCGKTRMVWLPDGEKNWRYLYSFWHNARTWQTHRERDRHTPHDGIGRAYA